MPVGVAGTGTFGARGEPPTSSTVPVADGDGGALALWIVVEVVLLVVGVAALRLWSDRRSPPRPPQSSRR